MPSLPKHDPLKRLRADAEKIDLARTAVESIVPTSVGDLQFDMTSRQRMNDVLLALEAGNPESTVTWSLADNSTVELTYEELLELITEAQAAVGPRTIKAFAHAQLLKQRLLDGEIITMRDISIENWPITN